MVQVFVVYHSGYGHTKSQAEAVLRGAASVPGVAAKLVTAEAAAGDLDQFDAADAIIFGCPTYMGSMSAEMKKFVEAASKKWAKLAWKDKVAGAFTNSASFSGDKLNTLFGLIVNAMQHGMIFVGTGMLPAESDPESMKSQPGPGPDVVNRVGSSSGAMAVSLNARDPAGPPPGDIETAERYGRRVAEAAARWARGKA